MDLDIIRNGVTYSLSDGTYCRLISDDGTGMLPMHRLRERGPLQHGSTDLGYFYDPRTILLMLAVMDTSVANIDVKRKALQDIFAPQTAPLYLRYTLDGGDVRQIECHYLEGLNLPHNQTGLHFRTPVTLLCNEPTFYDPDALNQVFAIAAGTDTWEVPFAVPWTVGASTIDSNIAISYGGNAPSYPIIRITGVATDPVLTNATLGLKLDFTGTTIGAADYYEIDLRYGRKTVVDSAGANQLADLTTDSDISTFRIAADPDAPGGINSLNFTCTAATLATACTVVYYERYIGI